MDRLDRLTRPLTPVIQDLPSSLILDGELIAVDEGGHPDFDALQSLMLSIAEPTRIGFLVFDCLFANVTNLMRQPLQVRREALRSLVKPAEGIAVVEAFPASAAPTLLAKAHEFGLEGVVCKRLGSLYRPGERSKDWIKVPLRIREEFVIGGFIAREREVGSLVVGQYHGKSLVFTGLVGTGLSTEIRDGLARRLKPLVRKACPFDTEPTLRHAFGEVDRNQVRRVRPTVVVEIEFTGRRKNSLRHAVLRGVRSDKDPSEISGRQA